VNNGLDPDSDLFITEKHIEFADGIAENPDTFTQFPLEDTDGMRFNLIRLTPH
jgi:hypothetical protein